MNIETIKAINDSPYKVFFAITGGGQTFIGDYCKVSGASKTVVGAIIPYSQPIFDEFIGCKVEFYTSEESARKLALAAYNKCIDANVSLNDAIGIGASSSIAKENERADREHKSYICFHCNDFTYIRMLKFVKEPSVNRDVQEWLVSEQIFNVLSSCLGFDKKYFCQNIEYKEDIAYNLLSNADYFKNF